jgi:hypothetical protein
VDAREDGSPPRNAAGCHCAGMTAKGRFHLIGTRSSRAATASGSQRQSNDRGVNMKPEHDVRRKVIREWMSLPRDKRQTQEQAAAFAMEAVRENAIGRSREDPHRRIMAWLLPRTGKA